ncbi:flagellar transcriptional regulator FlhD [Halomonas sp. BMC7]|jgi:flagellar transcriptional activator FlhD|nr:MULTISPECIES: flagellar transcriptional regulator FlhD [Halomonas]MDI4637788.1 flagellar transcriptional regulator FlhD [Halomonas sp. BMC7]NUJ58808.1 flagellar transcriptional regulator FlhD [Halomonas taeanensis]
MVNEQLLDEIQDLNLSYLLLAQRLLADDRATAMFRLKVDGEMADLLTSLSARQLGQLSRTNQLLCQLSLGDATQLQALVRQRREHGLIHTHASMILSQAPSTSTCHSTGGMA